MTVGLQLVGQRTNRSGQLLLMVGQGAVNIAAQPDIHIGIRQQFQGNGLPKQGRVGGKQVAYLILRGTGEQCLCIPGFDFLLWIQLLHALGQQSLPVDASQLAMPGQFAGAESSR